MQWSYRWVLFTTFVFQGSVAIFFFSDQAILEPEEVFKTASTPTC